MAIDEIAARFMEEAQPIIERWGLLAVGLGILSETLLFVGVFVPGFSLLVTAGMLAKQGALNPWAVYGVALAGGIIGDQTAYVIGRTMGGRLLRRHGKAMHRLRYALTHEGGYILLWYHYVAPLRIVIPYIAGSVNYPRGRWVVFDTIGLALWVGFAFSIGYVAMGPLMRFGNLGYYAVMVAVAAMFVYTGWKIYRLLRYRETPEDMVGEEAELGAGFVARVDQAERAAEQNEEPPAS